MQGKKLVVLAVLLISLFLVLFGCSGNKEVQSGNNDGASEANSNDKEVIELTLWNTWADEAAEAATRSEERRVGKECRSRRAKEHEARKKRHECESAQQAHGQ